MSRAVLPQALEDALSSPEASEFAVTVDEDLRSFVKQCIQLLSSDKCEEAERYVFLLVDINHNQPYPQSCLRCHCSISLYV
jgi:hypothetical protein